MSLIPFPENGSATDDNNGSSNESKPHSVLAWLQMMKKNNPPLPTPSVGECEPSADIILTLSPVQRQLLKWCLNQEASETRGGILNSQVACDNKIQAISLVVTARDIILQSEAGSSSLDRKDRCTLLICPYTSLREWQEEIEKTVKGGDRVFVFHGMKEEIDFSKYDFVITDNNTVMRENEKKLINNEETPEEAKNKAKGEIHPNKRFKITTSLLSGTWGRIIVDMPRMLDLKGPKASLLKLKSNYKWVINSATRLCNLKDLYPLILFLNVFPYSYVFCLNCDCRSNRYSIPKSCDICDHSMLSHFHFWRKYIVCAGQEHDTKMAEILQLEEMDTDE